MAIFGFRKKNDEKLEQSALATKALANKKSVNNQGLNKKVQKAKKVVASKVNNPTLDSSSSSDIVSVIVRPHITEKSGILSQGGVYTFEVSKNANKVMVKKAINTLYKVLPVNVSIINTSVKNVFVRGRKGKVGSIKKAIVTLKKGDKIDFV